MKTRTLIHIVIIVALIGGILIDVETAAAAVGNNVGDEAPDFSLPDTNNQIVTLSDHRESENVVLVFYRGTF